MKNIFEGLSVVIASIMVIASLPIQVLAAGQIDYDVSNGRFYTQTSGQDTTGRGYRITDDDDIPFWSEYQRLGAEKTLGYPISRRFMLDGTPVQATQRGVLQWKATNRQMGLINLMDYFTTKGQDPWLEKNKSVPKPAPQSAANQAWELAYKNRRALLDASPAFATYYDGNPDSIRLLGLASSSAVDRGDYIIMRFQRGVLVQWKTERLWAAAGDVTPSNAGDWAKENGLFPVMALELEAPGVNNSPALPIAATVSPTPAPPAPTATPTPKPIETQPAVSRGIGAKVTGLATWYGQPFHGRRTASGEVFDMYNPSTTACNIFPIGTWLKVTRVVSGNSIIVRVNDTGGFTQPYVVDLSYAAFQKLGGDQTQQVTVEVVAGPGG
jgi:hypothetical protein